MKHIYCTQKEFDDLEVKDKDTLYYIERKIVWLLDNRVFDTKERLKEAEDIIKSFGDTYYIIENPWLDWDKVKLTPEDIVIPLGSLGLYKSTFKDVDLNPYKVTYYSKFLEEDYLNNNYEVIPFWKLKSKAFQEYVRLEYPEGIFIKPDKGDKLFTGYVVDYDKFHLDLKSNLKGIKDDELIIVAPPVKFMSEKFNNVSHEFRFYIINNKIVTASSYSWLEDTYIEVPEEAYEYVEKIIKKINLEDKYREVSSYTLDIVQALDLFAVVDLNCIHTSGTYNCDLSKLLEGMRWMDIR